LRNVEGDQLAGSDSVMIDEPLHDMQERGSEWCK
jgi:hypothetical protein